MIPDPIVNSILTHIELEVLRGSLVAMVREHNLIFNPMKLIIGRELCEFI